MSVGEINDEILMGMLPATSPEMAVKLSGTDRKRSREYQAKLQYVIRRMKSLERSHYVRWDELRNGARVWKVIA